MALPKGGLGGFSERIVSWKQGTKQQRKPWVQEKKSQEGGLWGRGTDCQGSC